MKLVGQLIVILTIVFSPYPRDAVAARGVAQAPARTPRLAAPAAAQPAPAPAGTPSTACADVAPPNGAIDMVDIMSVAGRWGQNSGDPGWDARFDLDGDNAITVNDVSLAAAAWQTMCLPPDPATVAPPLDPAVVTDFGGSVGFLYSGPNPIQTGVVSGTIATERVAVLRGQVLDQAGAPLPGVTVTILDHPELGQTLSREDGMVDMAVNGGGLLTVDFVKDGYLPVQRQVDAPWQDFAPLDDVVMTALDPAVTEILLPGASIQVARGSVISDTDGLRQATLFVPPGAEATMVLPGGITQTLTMLHVRATEYTVGGQGPEAMPAELPANSGYTYAVELSVDEALAAGAVRVAFSQPVIQYLENFLGFPTGMLVPSGYYDRQRGVWAPSENGRVIKILSISNGEAILDTDGDGQPDPGTALGITLAERQRLATLYAAGQSLWRVPIPHFTPWDFNYPYVPDCNPAIYQCRPSLPSPDRRKTTINDRKPCDYSGSIIGCETQTLGEVAAVTGTPFHLRYSSDRVPGHNELYTLNVTLSGNTLAPTLQAIELLISGAGRTFEWSFPPASNQSYQFTWDGKDAYGRPMQGEQPFGVQVGYIYNANYTGVVDRARSFATYGDNNVLVGVQRRDELKFIYMQRWETVLGGSVAQEPDVSLGGLGGWTLSAHHVYGPHTSVLYRGDGGRQSAFAIGPTVYARAGSGDYGCSFGPVTAEEAWFTQPESAVFAPDGTLYIADRGCDRVGRVTPDGTYEYFAFVNDPSDLALDVNGDLLVASYGMHQVFRVTPAGVVTAIAGLPMFGGYSGDGGPATQARLNYPQGVAAGPDGSIYIADYGNHRIRRISPDGYIDTVAGISAQCPAPIDPCGDGGLAAQAQLKFPRDVAVAPDGSVYIADTGMNRIRKITPDGIIRSVAGTGNAGYGGDGGLATIAKLHAPNGVAVDAEGNVFIADTENHRVRLVSNDGVIITLAGSGQSCPVSTEPCGDDGNARQARFTYPLDMTPAQSGGLVVADTYDFRIRRVRLPAARLDGSNLLVPSSDSREVYAFDLSGRHLQTRDGLTGAVLLAFAYDDAGRLASVTDANGQVTVIERDGNGLPQAIVAPGGQRTELAVDGNGYLQSITNPAGEAITLTSTAGGLLTGLTDAMGNQYAFTYDVQGRLLRDDDPVGGFQTLARSGNATNYSVTRTTALGRTTIYQVEALPDGGIRRRVTDPNGGVSTAVIGADGSQLVTYPDGSKMRLVEAPDPRWGNLATVAQTMTSTVPTGLTQALTLQRTAVFSDTEDPFSLLWMTDTVTVNGDTSTTTYDAAQRILTDTSAAGRQRVTVLDSLGRVVSQTLGSGLAPVIVSYDGLGRRVLEQAGSQSLGFTYDAANRVTVITDGAGRQRQFSYDAAGRVLSSTSPGGHATAFAFDDNGNRTTITLPSAANHQLNYTPLNQPASYTPPGNASYATAYDLDRALVSATLPSGRAVMHSYDSGGRLVGQTYPEAAITLAYAPGDKTDRFSSVTRTTAAGTSQSIAFTYSARLVTGMAWTGAAQGQFSYTFNNDFHLAGWSLTSSPDTYNLAITRDDDGLITKFGPFSVQRQGPGGQASRIGDATLRVDYGYDALGRVSGKTGAANGTPFYDVQLTYDNTGRITQKVETVAGVPHTYVYAYDLDTQLTSVTRDGVVVEQYTYDANGNRLSRQLGANPVETSTYDGQDRLLQRGGLAYTIDADGFLAQRGADTFQYSAKGELLQAVVGGVTVTYAYDGLGRRVSRTSGGGTYQYLYGDLGNAFLVTAVRNPANQLTIYHYDEAGHLVAMERAGARYLIATDQAGTARVIRNAAGSLIKVLEFDSFGNLVSDSNPGFEFPFGFAGGLADTTTGLVRFGFRDYDPAAGRWTGKDPVFFDGGQGNLYVYVGNNPISLRDPSGLICVGGSFYAGLGGGGQLCGDLKDGFSICVEAGVGVGGDYNVSFTDELSEADEIGFEFNPSCFGVGATLGCGFKICNGTAKWECGPEGEAGPSFAQGKTNGETSGFKMNVGAPDIKAGRCAVQAKAFAKKCFVKRF